MRILVDVNLTPRWVQFFSDAGHECVHWSMIGPSENADVDICAYAREHEYVLVTNDLDFPQILANTRATTPSVILLRGQPLTPELRGVALLTAMADCANELQSGAFCLSIGRTDLVPGSSRCGSLFPQSHF